MQKTIVKLNAPLYEKSEASGPQYSIKMYFCQLCLRCFAEVEMRLEAVSDGC